MRLCFIAIYCGNLIVINIQFLEIHGQVLNVDHGNVVVVQIQVHQRIKAVHFVVHTSDERFRQEQSVEELTNKGKRSEN